MACSETVQRALLGCEFCLSVAAVAYFGLARPDDVFSSHGDGSGEPGGCGGAGACLASYAAASPDGIVTWTRRMAESSFALAILTLVVVLARATMLHLYYLPRYASALYDLLLSTLWLLNLAQQMSPSATPGGPGGDSTDGRRTVAAATSSAVGALAVTLYGGRLVWDVVVLWSGAGGSRGVASSAPLGRGYRDVEAPDLSAADEVYRTALSPVLAFFPDDMHDKTPWRP